MILTEPTAALRVKLILRGSMISELAVVQV